MKKPLNLFLFMNFSIAAPLDIVVTENENINNIVLNHANEPINENNLEQIMPEIIVHPNTLNDQTIDTASTQDNASNEDRENDEEQNIQTYCCCKIAQARNIENNDNSCGKNMPEGYAFFSVHPF